MFTGLTVFVLLGCAPAAAPEPITPTPAFVTATLPATPAPRLTEIPWTQTASTTPTALIGTTTTQINVRAEPHSASSVLGLLGASTAVQILGKDPNGNWYQIVYEVGEAGTGWVASEYVRVENTGAIPVVGGSDSEVTASVREQINVRRGPGTDFDSLGTLNARDVVTLTGKDGLGAWLQIAFKAGPGGKGWVAASFLEAPATDGLPIVAESGEVIGTSTPTGVPLVPTQTLVPARDDGDSAEVPAFEIAFGPSGVGSTFYSSDVSTPEGDAVDWIRFTPYYGNITISLACTGNGPLALELRQAGEVLAEGQLLTCGETRELTLVGGRAYTLRLTLAAGSFELTYSRYTVSLYGAASR